MTQWFKKKKKKNSFLPMQETRVRYLGQEDPRIRKCEPTPGLPGKSHGQRNMEGYSPWGRKEVRHDLVTEKQRD